jgi:hypothetical protein
MRAGSEDENIDENIWIFISVLHPFDRPENNLDFPKLSGPYLGQMVSGKTAVPFAPDILIPRFEYPHTAIVFTPDGRKVDYQARDTLKNAADPERSGIFMSRIEGGYWTAPRRVSWSLTADDAPFVSPDDVV